MKNLIIVVFLFTIKIAYGQQIGTYRLRLAVIPGNGPFTGGLVPTLIAKGAEISSDLIYKRRIKNYIVKQFNFQSSQYYYSKFLQGEIDGETLKRMMKIYQTDTSVLSKETIKQDVKILIGETYSGDKFYALDLNHDQSFAEEQFVYYKSKAGVIDHDKIPDAKVDFEIYYENKKLERQINIKPYPFKSGFKYRDSVENYLYLMMQCNEYRNTTLQLPGRIYDIVISNGFPSINYTKDGSIVYLYRKGEKNIENKDRYRIGDSIHIDKFIIYLKEIDRLGEEVVVEVFEKHNKISYGFRQNQIAPIIVANSLNNEKINSNEFNGNYVLIDFWGTWCGPCKENLPQLREMYKKFLKNEFLILGIASDKDWLSVKKYVDKEEIKWLNIFDSFENPAIVKAYRIDTFPTYILVDKNGKIVIRTEGKEGLLKVDKYLRNKLKTIQN